MKIGYRLYWASEDSALALICVASFCTVVVGITEMIIANMGSTMLGITDKVMESVSYSFTRESKVSVLMKMKFSN